ncbi:MAG TPA: Rrf2 family transcriptional regulator [Ruminococcaceae bacterium]|nr:Rrf2 family transcriptional regulator [Oscillospiraceae bacterium]
MRISSKVECGIISLVDICIYSNNSVVTVINISARQNISAKYLEQILPQLRQADIIRSVKGSHGGYVLTRPAEKITLRDVIDALDSTVLGECSIREDSQIADAISECLWSKMTAYLQDFTDSVTLRDIADKLADTAADQPMYYI